MVDDRLLEIRGHKRWIDMQEGEEEENTISFLIPVLGGWAHANTRANCIRFVRECNLGITALPSSQICSCHSCVMEEQKTLAGRGV